MGGLKLIIQIPCLNEEATLPATVADLPREVEGFDQVEFLVIDDGSRDRTVEVARELGVDHVAVMPGNRGLAAAFSAGLEVALARGADVIVNTDGDNQYYGPDIAKLVKPIIEGRADMVIGDRQTADIPHFSFLKKRLQAVGSFVVRRFTVAPVPDATSGFRAFTRDAAARLNIFSSFSYTLESIIQASRKGLRICSVPIRTNGVTRQSRLMRNTCDFVIQSGTTIFRFSILYKPLRFFVYVGSAIFLSGSVLCLRFLYYLATGAGSGHVQSLILAAILLIMGFTTLTLGVIADLIAVNRRLLEEQNYHLKFRARPEADAAITGFSGATVLRGK